MYINSRINNNIRSVYIGLITSFIFFFSIYFVGGYKEDIPHYMLVLQIIYAVSYCVCICYFSILKKNKDLYFVIFIYTLFLATIVRCTSWLYLNEPFLKGVDSITYDEYASYGIINKLSFVELSNYITQSLYFIKIDDLGMFYITYNVYKIFGIGTSGQNALLLLNCITITISSVFIYKTLTLYKIQETTKRFCTIAYACFPFFSLTAAVGLKENYFSLAIILSFYNILKYKITKRKIYVIYYIISIASVFFFRIATFLMLLFSCFLVIICNNGNKKRILYILILFALIGYIFIDVVLNYIYNINIQQVIDIATNRGESMNKLGGSSKWIINIVAVLCGPFPNFSKLSEYAFVHSIGVLMKVFLNFFALIGLCNTVRNYNYQFYPVLVYYFFNLVMLTLSGVALDTRYHMTLFPIMIPLIAKTFEVNKNNKLFVSYCFFIGITIWFYNNR